MKTIVDFATLVKTYITSQLSGKAPTNHASTATTYGVASETNYGHVKIVDYVSMGSTEAVTSNAVHNEIYGPMKIDQRLSKIELIQPKITGSLSDIISNINNNGSKNILPATLEDYIKWTTAVPSADVTIENNVITNHGVSWTVSDDGTLSATGKADGGSSVISTRLTNVPDGTYVISGGPTGGSSSTYRNRYAAYFADGTHSGWQYFTDYKQITLQNCILFRFDTLIHSGYTATNHIVKPMLCLKSDYDLDSTWEPYAKTNQQLTKDTDFLVDNTEVNGAVNKLPFPYAYTTRTENGVTYTVNDDGAVSTSGTSTATSNFYFTGNSQSAGLKLKAGSYKLSGNPGVADIPIWLYDYTSGSAVLIGEDTGDGLYFTLSTDSVVMLRISMGSGVNTDGYTFKPMITVASYTGDYVPYAKSNRELTDDVDDLDERIKNVVAGTMSIPRASITKNTATEIISAAGQYILFFTGTNSKCAMCFANVHETDSNGSFVETIFANGITLTFDKSTAAKIFVTSSADVRLRVMKIGSTNY